VREWTYRAVVTLGEINGELDGASFNSILEASLRCWEGHRMNERDGQECEGEETHDVSTIAEEYEA
jgi:hypothetical protein